MKERLTSRQIVKHSDGTEHIEAYCHGHRYGPAAFPKKYGSTDPKEYKDYCEMVDRLAALEDAEESRSNPKPLTLEQLRAMEGKPVYLVKHKARKHKGYWAIYNGEEASFQGFVVCKFTSQIVMMERLFAMDNPNIWQAYRDEPKEEK